MGMRPAGEKSMWQPTIPVNQSVNDDDTTQNAPLGTRLALGDRVFYYAYFSAACTAGEVVCAPVMGASHQADILTPGACTAGQKVVTLTLGSSMAANQYAEGYMMVSSGTGVGQTYRIKSHGTYGTAAVDCTINLYDDLVEPVTATCELNFVPNIYNKVVIGSSALGVPVGVSVCDVSAVSYAWIQTWGPAAANHVGATPAAAAIKVGTTGGVLQAFGAATTCPEIEGFVIGKNFNLAATAGENTPVYLTIRP